jgi:membrane protein
MSYRALVRPDPERGRLAGRPSVGLVVALWSASSGMRHLVAAVKRAYDEEETRGLIRLRGLWLILTIGAALAPLVVL